MGLGSLADLAVALRNWEVAPSPMVLVLLPYGGASDAAGANVPALRHAYRMTVQATRISQRIRKRVEEIFGWLKTRER